MHMLGPRCSMAVASRLIWINDRLSTPMYFTAGDTSPAGSDAGGMIMKNWSQMTKELSAQVRDLRAGTPDVMKAFSSIAQSALNPQALDRKTKELIALGICVAVRCDDCIAFHVKAAVEHGASRAEVNEVLGMAIYMGAGPSVMYASHALEAFDHFAASHSIAEPAREVSASGR
jgi:AhpD family alkylhydroperoxidase